MPVGRKQTNILTKIKITNKYKVGLFSSPPSPSPYDPFDTIHNIIELTLVAGLRVAWLAGVGLSGRGAVQSRFLHLVQALHFATLDSTGTGG